MALKTKNTGSKGKVNTTAAKGKSAPKGKASGKGKDSAPGYDRRVFLSTMKKRGDDMAAARENTGKGGGQKFPKDGTYYAVFGFKAGVKNDYNWIVPQWEVQSGEFEGQTFDGDFACNMDDKRAIGMYILARGLAGGQVGEELEDLIDVYESAVGQTYRLKVETNDSGYRNTTRIDQVDEIPDSDEEPDEDNDDTDEDDEDDDD